MAETFPPNETVCVTPETEELATSMSIIPLVVPKIPVSTSPVKVSVPETAAPPDASVAVAPSKK